MKGAMVALILIAPVAFVITAINAFTSMRYFCSECAAGRIDEDIRPFGSRSLGRIRGRVVETEFTTQVSKVVRIPCEHRWVFAAGSGGSFACILGTGATRRSRLREAKAAGAIDSAFERDPAGGVELVRWLLGRNIPAEEDRSFRTFESKDDFRSWFEAFRRRTQD